MIEVDIPGWKNLKISHLVLDYNGTLAVDGKLIDGVVNLFDKLASKINIHVITADTFGTAAGQLASSAVCLTILDETNQQKFKQEFVENLGANNVVAIGNGLNDRLMLQSAALSIAVMQSEGLSTLTMLEADIVCAHITDALELLLYPKRLTATLRK